MQDDWLKVRTDIYVMEQLTHRIGIKVEELTGKRTLTTGRGLHTDASTE